MEKKQLTLVVVSLLVVVLSVSVAYFTAQIIGEGKNVSVTSANLQIIFNHTDGQIAGTDIEPGWSSTKTFTIKNDTKSEYKYNIVIKDLVNTFVTTGYLQYKITSTNSGYNMTEFKDVPKSNVAADTVLASAVSVPTGVTQTYTIEFKYTNDENVDQSKDMGKKLSGTLFITEGKTTLYEQLLADKTSRSVTTRPDNNDGNASYGFTGVYTSDNTKTLYTSTENGTTVYYFAGNATDNWVKFGGFYWRIIRTNSDGSIRLLYHGTSTTAEDAYISTSNYNNERNDSMYVGYMYGTSDSSESRRTNTNSSTIKLAVDKWYADNLHTNYGKYLSDTAVYCSDRDFTEQDNTIYYNGFTRLDKGKEPTYDCSNSNDKFTVSSSTGNGSLQYPIGLMTADEVAFAGAVVGSSAPAYYYKNSAGNSSTGSSLWWTMTPISWSNSVALVFRVHGSNGTGQIDYNAVFLPHAVRPVTSIKSCVRWSSGDGTVKNPYTIDESYEC